MATFYSTGTITLTNGSAVVTGTGTAWQTALITGGTIFPQAPGNPLPIASVDSNSQITAAIEWAGANGTYDYALQINNDVNQVLRNAQALSEYIERLDDPALAALASLTPAADTIGYFTSESTAQLTALSAFARSLLDDANAAAAVDTLGFSAFVRDNLRAVANAGAARQVLGLVIGQNVQAYDSDAKAFPPLYLAGMEISSAATDPANDITVAAGYCRDIGNSRNIVLPAPITKRADAPWSAGDNQGGWDSGAVGNGWGYAYVIFNPTTGVVDAILSANPTAPTLPAGFTSFRYLGEFRRDSGANRAFAMGRNGRVIYTTASVLDVNGVTLATSPSATAITLTVPPSSTALFRAQASFSGTCAITLRNAVETITGTYGSLVGGSSGSFDSGHFELETDSLSRFAGFASNGNHTIQIWTYGWISRRGRI